VAGVKVGENNLSGEKKIEKKAGLKKRLS